MVKKLTPTQRKLMSVLKDGQRHESEELRRLCLRINSSYNLLRVHIHTLRAKIQPSGKSVVCEVIGGKAHYRLIEFPKPNDV